ncbi:hypothetical protein ACS0TY_012598 [Phlomoides rotata]
MSKKQIKNTHIFNLHFLKRRCIRFSRNEVGFAQQTTHQILKESASEFAQETTHQTLKESASDFVQGKTSQILEKSASDFAQETTHQIFSYRIQSLMSSDASGSSPEVLRHRV